MIDELLEQEMKESKEKTTAYQLALDKSTAYFGGDELAGSTWLNKYAMRDLKGNIMESSPDEMHRRMAKHFARIELGYKANNNLNGGLNNMSYYGQHREFLSEEKIYEFFKDF